LLDVGAFQIVGKLTAKGAKPAKKKKVSVASWRPSRAWR
jgi:hypothetical protein